MGALPRDLNASKTNDRPAPPRICSRATVAGGTIEGTPAALLSQSVGAADCGDRRAALEAGDQEIQDAPSAGWADLVFSMCAEAGRRRTQPRS
jgi:hypothetical protein